MLRWRAPGASSSSRTRTWHFYTLRWSLTGCSPWEGGYSYEPGADLATRLDLEPHAPLPGPRRPAHDGEPLDGDVVSGAYCAAWLCGLVGELHVGAALPVD